MTPTDPTLRPDRRRTGWRMRMATDPTPRPDPLREALASYIGRSGWVRPIGTPPDHDRAWQRMLSEANGMLEDPAIRAALATPPPTETPDRDALWAEKYERLRAALVAVRALHVESPGAPPERERVCLECWSSPFPCRTALALTEPDRD